MKTYLIFTAQGIGDFVIAQPLIQSIRAQDPTAIIDVFTSTDKHRVHINETLVHMQGMVRHCFYYTKDEPLHSLLFLLKAGYHAYDYGIVIEHLNSKYLSSWPSKIVNFCCKTTIGPKNSYNSASYTYNMERPDSYSIFALQDDILEQLGLERTSQQASSYDLDATPSKTPIITRHPSIVFCIGSGHVAHEKKHNPYALSLKSWPTDRWITLGNTLVKQGYEVILIGGSMEAGMIEPYQSELDPSITNYIGQHSLKESFQVVREADLVVGVDTGLIHAAAMQGTPTLTLFGCTDPGIVKPFGPYSHVIYNPIECSPCLGYDHSYTCTDNRCMQGISVETVRQHIEQILER